MSGAVNVLTILGGVSGFIILMSVTVCGVMMFLHREFNWNPFERNEK